jgi:RNA polymerase-binding transcription factor DksA
MTKVLSAKNKTYGRYPIPICEDCGLPIYTYRAAAQKRCRHCGSVHDKAYTRADNARRKSLKKEARGT